MKIYGWIGRTHSDRNAIALVEIEPDEVADVENMLRLLDGDTVGHFGVVVTLVADESYPKAKLDAWLREEQKPRRMGSRLAAQFGFPNASVLRARRRYYKVFVHRD